MTIETFASRVAAALTVGGLGLLGAAVLFWSTAGGGDGVVHSVHTVAGSVVVVFGLVLVGIGLAISTAIPPRDLERSAGAAARQEDDNQAP